MVVDTHHVRLPVDVPHPHRMNQVYLSTTLSLLWTSPTSEERQHWWCRPQRRQPQHRKKSSIKASTIHLYIPGVLSMACDKVKERTREWRSMWLLATSLFSGVKIIKQYFSCHALVVAFALPIITYCTLCRITVLSVHTSYWSMMNYASLSSNALLRTWL